MTSWPAPGPWIVRSLVISSCPLVSVMVGVDGGGGAGGVFFFPLPRPGELLVGVLLVGVSEKTMVSPSWAAAIASRREPAPLSPLVVTVSVLNRHRFSSASSRGQRSAGSPDDAGLRRRAAGAERIAFRIRVENSMMIFLSRTAPNVPKHDGSDCC